MGLCWHWVCRNLSNAGSIYLKRVIGSNSLWSVLFFLIATYNWFIMKSRLEFVSESFLNFLLMMVPPILFFLLISIFIPDENEKAKEHFLGSRRIIFGIATLFVSSIIIAGYLNGEDDLQMLAIQSIAVVLSLLSVLSANLIFRLAFALHIITSIIIIFTA